MVSVSQPDTEAVSMPINRSAARQSSIWEQFGPAVTKADDKMLSPTPSTKEHADKPFIIRLKTDEGVVQPSGPASSSKDDFVIKQLKREAVARQIELLELRKTVDVNKIIIADLESSIKREQGDLQGGQDKPAVRTSSLRFGALNNRLQAEIKKHAETTKRLDAAIVDKDKVVAELEARLQSEAEKHQAAVQRLDTTIKDKDAVISGFEGRVLTEVAGCYDRIMDLDKAAQAKSEAMTKLEHQSAAQLAEKREEIRELKEALEKYQSSAATAHGDKERLSPDERAEFETRIADLTNVVCEQDRLVFGLQEDVARLMLPDLKHEQDKMLGGPENGVKDEQASGPVNGLKDEQASGVLDFETFRQLIAEHYTKTTALQDQQRTAQTENNNNTNNLNTACASATSTTIAKLEQDLAAKSTMIRQLEHLALRLEDITIDREHTIAKLAADVKTKDVQLGGAIKTNVALSAALAEKDVTTKQLIEALCIEKDDKAKALLDALDRAADKKAAKKQQRQEKGQQQQVPATTTAAAAAATANTTTTTTMNAPPLPRRNSVSGNTSVNNRSAYTAAAAAGGGPVIERTIPRDQYIERKRQEIMDKLRPVIIAGAAGVPPHKLWPDTRLPLMPPNWLPSLPPVEQESGASPAENTKEEKTVAPAQPKLPAEGGLGPRRGPRSGLVWKAQAK